MLDYIKECDSNKQQNQQNCLSSKLKERLGYLGVYSQRNYRVFFEQLSTQEQHQLFQILKADYYQILINYFKDDSYINDYIDRFVEKAFFANLPIDKVVEIHMDLIDDFSRKLKLEGLHPDFLSDYRLALIDVVAHLGEMYRSVITERCIGKDQIDCVSDVS